jgi:uncharacterized protein YndB with AHSA1/START domain
VFSTKKDKELDMSQKLTMATPSDREIRVVRVFDAPRSLVWDCHTKPALVRKWLLGPPGWTMPVCEIDLRVGGQYRFEWAHGETTMGVGGVFREVVQPGRLAKSELFDEDWTGGEALGTQVFEEQNGQTTLTTTYLYSSKAARDGALATPMAEGLERGYGRLDELVAGRG